MAGILDRRILDTPMAVVDLETTGLYPGGDRIVELAVVQIQPGKAPALVLDTLVNPRRPVSATEIHGITDADVADAPRFEELAGNLASAIAESVFASYNVYFDAKFVQAELGAVGVKGLPPNLCLMYMRPLLGMGSRCSLADACECHGVEHGTTHWAAADALAAARLWQVYLVVLERVGLQTFRDLAAQRAYKFTRTFSHELWHASIGRNLSSTEHVKSRGHRVAAQPTVVDARLARQALVGEYWDAVTAALVDLDVTADEIRYLQSKQNTLALTGDELRWVHARAFAGILADVCQDKAVTRAEADALWRVHLGLRKLGWAPGDPGEARPEAVEGTPSQVPRPASWSIRNWFGRGGPNPS